MEELGLLLVLFGALVVWVLIVCYVEGVGLQDVRKYLDGADRNYVDMDSVARLGKHVHRRLTDRHAVYILPLLGNTGAPIVTAWFDTTRGCLRGNPPTGSGVLMSPTRHHSPKITLHGRIHLTFPGGTQEFHFSQGPLFQAAFKLQLYAYLINTTNTGLLVLVLKKHRDVTVAYDQDACADNLDTVEIIRVSPNGKLRSSS